MEYSKDLPFIGEPNSGFLPGVTPIAAFMNDGLPTPRPVAAFAGDLAGLDIMPGAPSFQNTSSRVLSSRAALRLRSWMARRSSSVTGGGFVAEPGTAVVVADDASGSGGSLDRMAGAGKAVEVDVLAMGGTTRSLIFHGCCMITLLASPPPREYLPGPAAAAAEAAALEEAKFSFFG
ncbi:hypothetical protein CPB84DRAFT_1765537 [Gymnopilus junonius]|uniref:Uncharacterized protein n=1 Tax=Gymnopilus junonius TaxID=109634 RepID=A0A9P5TS28_GYMJU|nr:hypothetical protein CPB84DRAFT_1765537 [Gymnopilus junonius]